jgi:ribose-phosphate pyrophosphokinase
MDHRASIIANPHGESWDFAVKVFEYLKQKEAQEQLKQREDYLSRIEQELKKVFHDDPPHVRDDRRKFAEVLYTCLNNGGSGFELNPLDIREFDDEEYKSTVLNNIRGSDCYFIHDSNLHPAIWHSQLDMVNNAIRNSSANRIISVLPYLKFSRQERKDVSRTAISAQAIARIPVYYNGGVLTVDVHAKAIQGFHSGPSYDQSFDSLESFPTQIEYLRSAHPELLENLVILCPDEGEKKRVEEYARACGFGVAMVDKSRDRHTGKITVNGICGDKVEGKHVYIPDDIAAKGSTQIAGAGIAREYHALTVTGGVTFGLFTQGIERVAKELNLLIVSDIIKQPYKKKLYSQENPFVMPPNVEYFSCVPLVGEGIYRRHMRTSLSALFETPPVSSQ